MPAITWFGWFHTVAGGLAVLIGFYTLARFKLIRLSDAPGKIYIGLTLFTALSALAIYKHGGFGVAHALAVLTLLAVGVGAVAEKTALFGGFSRYLQAASYSATLLFHMIPAITDGLMRLPVDDPIVSEIEDPMLRGFYLAFLLTYSVGVLLQFVWLKRNPEAA